MTLIRDVADARRDTFLDAEPIGAGLPAFPVAILPAWLRAEVEALAEAVQVPVDLPAMLSLSVVSACVQRAVVVEARPGEREPVIVWVLVALPSGDGKTPCYESLLSPVIEAERRWRIELAPDIARAESKRRQLEQRLKASERGAALATDATAALAARNDAAVVADELATTMVPLAPRLVTSDPTPEAMSRLAADHGRIAAFSDEGGFFATQGGRYSGMPNLDPMNKGWAGSDIRVDRVTEGRSHSGRRCCLTIGLCLQPATIERASAIAGLRDTGALPRFLFSVPHSLMGYRTSILETRPVAAGVRNTYRDAITGLLERNRKAGGPDGADPRVLPLSGEALAVLDAWQRELEPRLRPAGDLRDLADWCGKLRRAHVVRVASILHLAHEAGTSERPEVTGATMSDAVDLARSYLLPHARKGFDLFDRAAGTEAMWGPLLAAIKAAGSDGLTRTECTAVFHRHRTSAQVGAALAELERAGRIREAARTTDGRTAEVWIAVAEQ